MGSIIAFHWIYFVIGLETSSKRELAIGPSSSLGDLMFSFFFF